uniref:DUF3456 domain-containing protein n=1 Tax=Panagrolaimus superbus TaxID=310955 RepID=A0A914ZA19_9BILA
MQLLPLPQSFAPLLYLFFFSTTILMKIIYAKEIEKYSQIDPNNIQMPTKCEGCLILSREIETVLLKLNTKIGKEDAEIWLIEKLETVCEEMLHLKIHKEKPGIDRFSPDSSKTMKTLKNLRKKGVKVSFIHFFKNINIKFIF